MHRDIKPENILISPQGRMTFADFGLSFIDTHKSTPFHQVKAYDLVGTPGYFAPELLSYDLQRTGYTPAADIYSLGLVFLELFARLDDAFYNANTDYDQLRMLSSKSLCLDQLVQDEDARDLLSHVCFISEASVFMQC